MAVKTKSGRVLMLPTPEEDAAIKAGIAADPDTHELSDAEMDQLRPMRGRGRPAGSGTKQLVTVRIDVNVIDAFKQDGAGWQTRMNDALREWTHKRT